MPRHSRSEIKAGAVILVAFVLLCVGILIVGDFDRLLAKKTVHCFLFRKVQGLKTNDDVLYAGLKVGRVMEIEYRQVDNGIAARDPGLVVDISQPGLDNVTAVLVTAEVDADTPIQVGDEPVISRGLTGTVFLDIAPGPGGGKRLSSTTETKPLKGKDYPDLGEALATATEKIKQIGSLIDPARVTLDHAQHATKELRTLLERNKESIDQTIEHATATAKRLDEVTAKVGPSVKEAVANLLESSKTAKEAIDEVAPQLKQISKDLKATSKGMNAVVVGNRRNVDLIIENMRQASARLSIGIEDLRRNPWKLLTRNIEADAYTQNIYDAARGFSTGAVALSQTSASLESILAQGGTGVAQIKDAAAKLDKLIGDMQKLETELYEALKNRPK